MARTAGGFSSLELAPAARAAMPGSASAPPVVYCRNSRRVSSILFMQNNSIALGPKCKGDLLFQGIEWKSTFIVLPEKRAGSHDHIVAHDKAVGRFFRIISCFDFGHSNDLSSIEGIASSMSP